MLSVLKNKFMKKIIIYTAIYLSFYSNANAIALLRVNDDLKMEIPKEIEFIANQSVVTSRLGFKFLDAINVAGTGGFGISYDSSFVPILSGADFNSGTPDFGLIRGGSSLEILYFLPSSESIKTGDSIKLSPGNIFLPNFFRFSIIKGISSDFSGQIVLSQTSGSVISNPGVAVPDSGQSVFGYLSIFILMAFFKKRTSKS